jgi:hypothetical protein
MEENRQPEESVEIHHLLVRQNQTRNARKDLKVGIL